MGFRWSEVQILSPRPDTKKPASQGAGFFHEGETGRGGEKSPDHLKAAVAHRLPSSGPLFPLSRPSSLNRLRFDVTDYSPASRLRLRWWCSGTPRWPFPARSGG